MDYKSTTLWRGIIGRTFQNPDELRVVGKYDQLQLRVRLDTTENGKLKLKTEKHYSKIIFKCVNSTMEPIFNEKVP